MRKFGRLSKLIALLLTLTLVFVAGCQSIGSVNFNTVLKNALKVTSSESKQTVELKLMLDEKAFVGLPENDLALMKLVSSIKLELNNVKLQDTEHMSLDGNLIFGDEATIAFNLKMSNTLAVLELDGAKQPIVLDLTSEALLGFSGMPADAAQEAEATAPALDNASLTALGHQFVDTIADYIIHNMPNPEGIEVKPANETINGQVTSLMHVHLAMNGPEIWAWVKKYVDALVADRAGMDKMIAGVFEVLASNPEILEAAGFMTPFEEGGLDAPTPEETLKATTDEIAVLLTDLQAELKLLEEEEQETMQEIFSEELVITADVYVDSKLDIRKQVYELSYMPGEASELGMLPFKGLSIKLSGEAWNVNGEVKADAPVASDTAIPAEDLAMMQGYQILKQLDEKSVIYDLLKNKLHIGKQTINWYPYDDYNPAIITAANITIIPLRDTVDQLGAEIAYDAKTKNLKVFDEATNTTINVKIGSDTAVINGKSVKWSFPATAIEGTTYVSARDVAKALGAKIYWTTIYIDEKVFTFEREV
ncbi:copper amine oxidase N-terminal domain-containing protein [Paenibacillus sp. sgz302251]|uniref:copper amine oxidase N-terminal domain-containing protein n=1 Tax=Paenibacillus sp. sgz302251 TaxID=3414493 RepID=UPI003C7DF963